MKPEGRALRRDLVAQRGERGVYEGMKQDMIKEKWSWGGD